jgi:transcriptional regulator with XRE-family HTH domain
MYVLLPFEEVSTMKTSEKLRQRRTDLKLSQAAVAQAAGMSTVQYNGYENERHEPSEATMTRLAKALKAKPDDLWYDAVEDPETVAGLKEALRKRAAADMGVKVSEVRILIEVA